MRSLRSAALAVLLSALTAATASAAARPPVFQDGRYAALEPKGSVSFVLKRSLITKLHVRMPLTCRNSSTHARTAPGLAFGAGGARTTYARIYLPADGATNVSFVADDAARRPQIYLSLQLHGGVGHVSVHARANAARESCEGELGFDVRVR
jgi:hypothetical protein